MWNCPEKIVYSEVLADNSTGLQSGAHYIKAGSLKLLAGGVGSRWKFAKRVHSKGKRVLIIDRSESLDCTLWQPPHVGVWVIRAWTIHGIDCSELQY